jgi:hypothetical protein
VPDVRCQLGSRRIRIGADVNRAASDHRYNTSEKGRARARRYNTSEKGLERGRRYDTSAERIISRIHAAGRAARWRMEHDIFR